MEESIEVIIVTYNSSQYIESSLRSILSSKDIKLSKVIVVDNASIDKTFKIVENFTKHDNRVMAIKLKRNMGFPYACNIGVKHSTSKYIVIMNPDVIVDSNCFANLLRVISSDESIAVAQPKILHPGNYIDSAGGLMDFLGHGFHIGKYEKDHGQYNVPRDILYACFACAMVRRDVYLKLGGLDPGYFLYDEDLDFCWRSWLAGYRVVYVPSAVAYHIGQHASRRVPYHSIYFGRRNRLYMIFTNYSLPLALISATILATLYIIAAINASIRGDPYEARLTLKTITSFFKQLKRLVRRRLIISNIRKIGDRTLFKYRLIFFKLIGLRLYISRLYRRQLALE